MKVHWTESALADLQAVEMYIARHSPQFAHGMVDRILARSGQLETHPRLGAIVPDYDDEALRELFEDPYRIVYRVGEDQVDIGRSSTRHDDCRGGCSRSTQLHAATGTGPGHRHPRNASDRGVGKSPPGRLE